VAADPGSSRFPSRQPRAEIPQGKRSGRTFTQIGQCQSVEHLLAENRVEGREVLIYCGDDAKPVVWDCISGYLDDTLPLETREFVQNHLDHCEICSAILDSTRNILILTAGELIFQLPIGLSERLHARLDQEMTG
jgi:hypothetical protein